MNSPEVRLRNTTTQAFLGVRDVVSGKVLDMQCGDKPYKRLFPDCDWVGMDMRPGMGDVQGDPHKLPFDDGTFDTVLCFDLLHICQSPLMVMMEISRVLKEGGRLIVSAPNSYRDDTKCLWNITGRGLEYLIAASKLNVDSLSVDGRLFSHEWAEEFGTVHPDLKGWLDKMDRQYPQISFAVATKPKED